MGHIVSSLLILKERIFVFMCILNLLFLVGLCLFSFPQLLIRYKGNCFMLTQCHAGLQSWKWRWKFLARTFCGVKIQFWVWLVSSGQLPLDMIRYWHVSKSGHVSASQCVQWYWPLDTISPFQSLCPVNIFLTSLVGPKINSGNVGTSAVGPIFDRPKMYWPIW